MKRTLYNLIPAYNNSFLTQVKNHLMGRPNKTYTQAMNFGTAVHLALLEPDKELPKLPPSQERLLARMLEEGAATVNQYIKTGVQIETVKTWKDHKTNLPCKGIFDIYNPIEKRVIDVKTTRAKTKTDILAAIKQYEYDRQAAFYLDAVDAYAFTFLFMSKTKPYPVFEISYDWNSPEIKSGRRKYQFLLKKCQELDIMPVHLPNRALAI